MKKIILLISLFYFSFLSNISIADNYLIGDKIENRFPINKNFTIDLSPGTWQVVRRDTWSGYGISQRIIGIARIENKEIMEAIEIYEGLLSGTLINNVDPIIVQMVFKNKYDGCYDRPEYFILKYYRKGSTHNCFTVKHFDLPKALKNPDDPEKRGTAALYNDWISKNNIIVPNIVLASHHSYFSRLINGNWFQIFYMTNPKVYNAPKSKFLSEEKSEYHKFNIEQYPEHEKIMKKWTSIAALRHKEFEKNNKIKSHHELDLKEYISLASENRNNKNTVNQLKQLNDLFKSGVLTQEEFEKAKAKILN